MSKAGLKNEIAEHLQDAYPALRYVDKLVSEHNSEHKLLTPGAHFDLKTAHTLTKATAARMDLKIAEPGEASE